MEMAEQARQVGSAARLALGQWWHLVGDSGTAAMAGSPGLLAMVDQHAALVRDAVADRHGRVHPETLAAYADGLTDAAVARGWSLRELADGDWNRASTVSVRLLAVCVLAAAVA